LPDRLTRRRFSVGVAQTSRGVYKDVIVILSILINKISTFVVLK